MSSARNLGLLYISGEYVMFCDSDDYCFPEMLDNLLASSDQTTADVVVAKTIEEGKNGKRSLSRTPSLKSGIYTHELIIKNLYENRLGWGLLDKLWRVDLLEGVRFPENMVRSEDAYFALDLYINAKKLVMVDEAYYLYFKYRDGNSTTAKKKKYFVGPILYCEKLFDSAINYHEQYKLVAFTLLLKNYINYYLYWLSKPQNDEGLEEFLRVRHKLKTYSSTLGLNMKWRFGSWLSTNCPCFIYFGSKVYRKFRKDKQNG